MLFQKLNRNDYFLSKLLFFRQNLYFWPNCDLYTKFYVNFYFWPTFWFLAKIWNFRLHMDFLLNLYCGTKFVFLDKIFIFRQNFYFWPKFVFLTKICIFGQNFYFWRAFLFLTNISIFDQNLYFWHNFLIQQTKLFPKSSIPMKKRKRRNKLFGTVSSRTTNIWKSTLKLGTSTKRFGKLTKTHLLNDINYIIPLYPHLTPISPGTLKFKIMFKRQSWKLHTVIFFSKKNFFWR